LRTTSLLALTTIALAALIAGCGGTRSSSTNAASGSGGAPATSPASTGSAPQTALITTKQGKLGTILAYGPKRLTVYLFEADRGAASSCMSACAHVWPPVTGTPHASGQATGSDLATIMRPDGTTQVTYKGHPLYLYARDMDDGDAYGQGVKGFGAEWYAVRPSGDKAGAS